MASRPIITHVIVGLHLGGAERSLKQLVGATNEDFDHRIICFGSVTPLGEEIEQSGVEVHYIELSQSNPFSWLGALARARRRLADNNPDLIQGWMYLGNIIASLLKRIIRSSAQLVWNVRSDVTNLSQEKWTTRWAIRAAQLSWLHPQMIVYNSHAAQHSHSQFGFDCLPGQVIVNGVDTHRFFPNKQAGLAFRVQYGLSSTAPCVGLIGRFHPVKGVDLFLAAAAVVMQQYPQLQVVLIGPEMDQNNPALLAQIHEAGLPEQQVHALGALQAVPDALNALDTLVMASRREGTPNVILEAMASGIASVSTRVGDVPRLLDDPSRLAQVGDSEALARCIVNALENPGRWQESDHQLVDTHYTVEACVANYRGTYATLLT